MKQWFIILCTIVLVALICGTLLGQEFGKISDTEWQLTPPDEYPDVKALIIFDHGDMELTAWPIRIKLDRHVRIKVFDKNRADEALTIEIPYSDGDKIVGLKAHTINRDGKKIEATDFYDKRIGAYRTITFTFPAVEDGAVLEYKYKLSHQRITFLDPWYFQNYLYTIESRFSFTPNPGFSYMPLLRCMPAAAHHPQTEDVKTMAGEMTKFTWTLHKLPPFRDEPLEMAKLDYRTSVLLQLTEYRDSYQRIPFIKDWGYIGGIIKGRVDQLIKKGEKEVDKLSDSLMSVCSAPERYIEACFSFIRDNIKTNNLSKVDTFKEILEKKEAWDTDKNILLAHLLRAKGFTAYPMMIGTRDLHSPLDSDVSQLNTLNSVICSIADGSKRYGLDTGPKSSVYPYLPKLERAENGLVIKGDSCGLVLLAHRDRKNGCDILSSMHISDQGSGICTTTVYIKGYSMDGLLDDFDKTLTKSEWFERIFDHVDIDYEILDADVRYEPESDRITCDFVVEFPAMGRELDGNYFVCPFILNSFANPFKSIYRATPIDFRVPFQDRTRLSIQIPENMQVVELPDDIQHAIPNLSFTRQNQAVGNIIEINSALNIQYPVFEIMQYPELKNTFDAIDAMNKDEILYSANGR